MTDDSAPTKLDAVFDELAERGARVQRDDTEFQQSEARLQREHNLNRAQPRITDEDYDRLIAGTARDTSPLLTVQAWYENSNHPILAIGGSTGIGKSVAGGWLCAEHGASYLHVNDMMSMWDGNASQRARLAQLMRARYLVLDDLATERDRDVVASALYEFVDIRQGSRMRSVILTNVARDRLRERYTNERVWSRLARSWQFIGCTGPDLRQNPDAKL